MYLTIYLDRGRLAGLARIVIQDRGRLARIVIIGPRSSRPHLIYYTSQKYLDYNTHTN